MIEIRFCMGCDLALKEGKMLSVLGKADKVWEFKDGPRCEPCGKLKYGTATK